jgi:hypothetical protein
MLAAQSGGYTGKNQKMPSTYNFPEITELLTSGKIDWKYYVTSGKLPDTEDAEVVGTMAIFDVICPSKAFKVETNGWASPLGHKVKYPRSCGGTTVAFSTTACALAGIPQGLAVIFSLICPENAPVVSRVSTTRQGGRVYSDRSVSDVDGAK